MISTWWCDQDTWGGLYSGLPIIDLYTSFPPGHNGEDDEDYDDMECDGDDEEHDDEEYDDKGGIFNQKTDNFSKK